jgi:AraC family transcriptional regulator, positive regulator of tynA and feaB
MSQGFENPIDPRSHAVGVAESFSTRPIRPAERLSYWRESVLRRMEPSALPGAFQASFRRVAGAGAALVDHCSGPIEAERTALRCRRDGGDEISIDLMVSCRRALLEHNGTLKLSPGDLCVVDYAQPNRVVRSEHRAAALGEDPAALAGLRLPGSGLGAVLRSHLRATLDAAPQLTPEHIQTSLEAAVSLGLAVLLAAHRGEVAVPPEGGGLRHAAIRLIERSCTDTMLTPERLAQTLGCSRATLYRAFDDAGAGGVAARIWQARLEIAHRLLAQSAAPIGDIAWRSGFTDTATFIRMFRRRYGMTPGEASRRNLGGLVQQQPDRRVA